MEFESFKNFDTNYRRLITLYNAILYSFELASKKVKDIIYVDSQGIDLKSKIYLDNNEDENYLIAGNMYELSNKYKKGYIKQIDSILLIRLISMLEVFLIETIKEIFRIRKDMFQTEKIIEISYSELFATKNISDLWGKTISKDCRNLHSRGFLAITKYYKNNFNICFSEYENFSTICKAHEIRHLIVHRMGKTDEQYRKTYSETVKELSIDKDEFINIAKNVQNFTTFVKNKCTDLIIQKPTVVKNEDIIEMNIRFSILNDEECKMLIADNYSFFYEDQLILLKNILKSKNKTSSMVELKLVGQKNYLHRYFIYLKRANKKGYMEILDCYKKKC